MKNFDEDRLNRGYDYFIKDRVYDMIITDEYVTAKVEGSRQNIYEVKISLDDNEISKMECNCPYAYSDFNCKHMVATLYKYYEILYNKIENIENDMDKQLIFKEILNDIPEDKLKRYLYDSYSNDDEFMEKFINAFQKNFTYEDYLVYEDILNDIFTIDILEFYNENGFYEESPFHRYLTNFINHRINALYKNRQYEYVKQLLFIIYDNIAKKVDIDNYIDVEDILLSCNYYLDKIIDNSSQKEKESIYDYLLNNIEYSYNKNTTHHIIKICIEKYDKKAEYKKLDSLLDKLIEDKDKISEEILIYKYVLMQKLDYPLKQMDNFLYEHRQYKEIMDILISKNINEYNIDTAIELLNENKEIHGKLHSLNDSISLVQLYQSKNDREGCIRELESIIYEFDIRDLDYIDELKKLYNPDQWTNQRNNLIKYYQENYEYEFLNMLYVNEKLYDELYENITDNCAIDEIEKYRSYYENKHNDDILLIYKRYILDMAKKAKHRGAYTVIRRYLELMLTYDDSIEITEDLINTLKNKYKNKPLFIEELEDVEVQILSLK